MTTAYIVEMDDPIYVSVPIAEARLIEPAGLTMTSPGTMRVTATKNTPDLARLRE